MADQAYEVVDMPQVPGIAARPLGDFRWWWTARLCVRALNRSHRRACPEWPECSTLWRYAVRRKAEADRG